MRTRLRSKLTLLVVVCAVLVAIPAMAMALITDTSGNTAPPPTIQSDKADYGPGELVTLTGSNWQQGESVHIVVNDSDGQTWSHDTYVTADESGNITDQFNLPDWFVANYNVTATGELSGTATATFTDAVKAEASVDQTVSYRNTTGNNYTFTVKNTSNAGETLRSVEITRPTNQWTITSCSTTRAQWTAVTASDKCTFNSTGNAIPVNGSDNTFKITADVFAGNDITNKWGVKADDVSPFGSGSSAGVLSGGSLDADAYTFQVKDAVITTSNPTIDGACPAANKSAPAGSSRVVVICGRQGSGSNVTPISGNSSLGGTMIGTAGSFNSGSVSSSSNNNDNVVLAYYSNTTITSPAGSGKTVVAKIGAANVSPGNTTRTSLLTTLTGYEATPPNTAPVADGQSVSTNEDNAKTITLTGSDVDGNNLTFSTVAGQGPTNGTLGAIGPVTCTNVTPAPKKSCSADVTYTPNANYNGADSFTFRVNDGTVDSTNATVSITVNPDNDTPQANDGTETVAEGGGPITIDFGALVSDVETSDANLTYNIGSPNPSGSLSGTGSTRNFTPAANFNGTVTINYTVTDRGDPDNCGAVNSGCTAAKTSAQKTVTVTVTEVNDAPAGANDSKSTPENTPLVFPATDLTGNDSKGPTNESGQTLTVTDVGVAVNGTVGLSSGQITFTPTTNYNGPASFKYTVCDNGTTNGAPDPKCEVLTATVNVTVSPVNSAPEATDGTSSMNEDAAPITIDFGALVSDVETSDANLTYNVNIAAADSAKGSLASVAGDPTKRTFDSANDFNGTVEILYTVTDRGDPDNCSASPCDAPKTSAQKKVTVTVNPVNDVPSFTKGADQTVLENAGAQTVTAWATSISKGPADESTQTLSFQVSNNTSNLFSAQPAISSDGTLTYTPATDAVGKATVTVSLKDSGGTANGGVDTSAAQTFTINVNYKFDGFRSPVDKVPTWNTVKAGSSIPVKFSLSGYQGMNIFALNGVPVSAPSSAKINCDTGATDALEEVGTAGSSGLNYDSTIDQYNYLWKSDKTWGGTCRMLTVELKDGTIHQAKFMFTK